MRLEAVAVSSIRTNRNFNEVKLKAWAFLNLWRPRDRVAPKVYAYASIPAYLIIVCYIVYLNNKIGYINNE